MICPNCRKEFFDNEQIICEYCGADLAPNLYNHKTPNKSKVEQFIEDSGIKDVYKKVKESFNKLKK